MSQDQTPIRTSNDQAEDQNKLIAERRAKLNALREGCKANAHHNDFDREHRAGALQQEFGDKSKEELAELNKPVSIAGRVMRRGGPWVGVQDVSGIIQVYIGKELQKTSKAWELLDLGDIVGARGSLQKSGKGEL